MHPDKDGQFTVMCQIGWANLEVGLVRGGGVVESLKLSEGGWYLQNSVQSHFALVLEGKTSALDPDK